MSFLTPLFLLGALAAGIPVVIHMIHAARAPRVLFPTLRFLRSAAERTARRRRLENVLLLLLRMLLFAVLAFALSRPFLKGEFALFGKAEAAAVIILDNSYSMNVTYEGKTRYSQAKHEAKAILDSEFRPHRCAVVLANPGLKPLPEELVVNRAEIFQTIEQSSVSAEAGDLTASLRYAYGLLDKSRAVSKRIYVITDRQALSWAGVEELDGEHRDIPVAVIRVGEPEFSNVGVTDVEVRSEGRAVGVPVRIRARVRNSTGAGEVRNVLLFVQDMAEPKQSRLVELGRAGEPGAVKTVEFEYAFCEPGVYRCMVAVDGADSLMLDNQRRFAVEIAESIRVLLIKDASASILFQDDNFYLLWALDPYVGVANRAPWAIVPREKLTNEVSKEDLDASDLVVLSDVGGMDEALANALSHFVATGHTAVVFLGPKVNLEEYNKLLAEGREPILPAKLLERTGDAVSRLKPENITEVERKSPWLEGLVDKSAIFENILVYEYVRAEPVGSAEVLARLGNGAPFLLRKPYGRGQVLLFTTTANTAWTNFPVRKLFGPLMVRIARLSIRSTDFEEHLQSGRPLRLDFWPERGDKVAVDVTNPQGATIRVMSEPADSDNVVVFKDTYRLGFYSYTIASGTGSTFAVNPVGTESDLAEMDDDALYGRISAREKYVADSFSALVGQFKEVDKRELWHYFLASCLVLAVFECLIANWTRPGRTKPVRSVR